uniref:C3H29 n=1 Tax=Santalum album TaxID=35974 RepID=A0A1Z1EDH1_SANAL|nr:C3H29 [Santalum album]
MCQGSKTEPCPTSSIMEGGFQAQNGGIFCKQSNLLDLSASDDLAGFIIEVEEKGSDLDEPGLWYGRRIGSKNMGYEERTPLMIAALFGSTGVLKFIVESGKADANRASGSDGATALHCAAAGGSESLLEIVKLLLNASADVNSVDAKGNKPGDLIAPALKSSCNSRRKTLQMLLRGASTFDQTIIPELEGQQMMKTALQLKEGSEKKDYPVDISLPDINNGIYGSDEFRMYTFKVKPCSRAYTHDWTECPFVHPGENARRRDPRKYPYSCVPCPEFRKGSCRQGDACEYAHGVFECWLHPAQYRTRLCKDETGCNRKVCFFAHKPEDLRPVYASTGSAIPSSTPPMSPTSSPVASSPKTASLWNKANLTTPPSLQLPGSRLKTSFNARDLDLEMEMELLGLGSRHTQQQQRLMDYTRIAEGNPNNLNDMLGGMDTSVVSQLQGLHMRQSMNQLRASYPSSALSSSPVRKSSSFGVSRSAAFTNRSQSFADRGGFAYNSPGLTGAANSAALASANLSGWSSPSGKLDWGVQGEELSKLKKSASFAFRGGNAAAAKKTSLMASTAEEPDVSWVNSLVKDVPSVGNGHFGSDHHHHHQGGGIHEMIPPWVEQLYIEQEQMVA